MDDQQNPDHTTQQRPRPAGRISVPVSDVGRMMDGQPTYPRLVKTNVIPLDMPRSRILLGIDDAIADCMAEVQYVRISDDGLALYGERSCASPDDADAFRGAIMAIADRITDGMPIGVDHHVARRDAIHLRMRDVVGDAYCRWKPTDMAPTDEAIAERDRMLIWLRASSCAFGSEGITAITECLLSPQEIARLRGLADAEREIAERIDDDRLMTDDMRRAWSKSISRVVAARDRDIRRARWVLEHRIEAARPDSPAAYAWTTLRSHAEAAGKRDGPHGTPDDRLRVLMAWIVAAGGRTMFSEMLLHLWRQFPLRRSEVKSLLDAAYAVQRMRPLVERAMRPDIEDLRRDWRAWHSGSRIAVASMIALVGTPDPCRESVFIAPRWLRRLARDHFTADGSVVADHLAHVVEGKGPWRNMVVSEIRNGMPRLLVGGATRPFVCSDPDDDVVDERPAFDMTGDDGEQGGPAMARHTVSAEPVRTTVQAPAPLETPTMSAPSSAAEAAAAKSDNRIVREAHAIASRARREIVGQEPAIRMLSAMVAEAKAGRKERGIGLLAGSSGSGKTHAVGVIAGIAGLPFLSLSVANFVSTGIRGPNVDDIALGLIRLTKGNLEAAVRGTVLLDEADKLMMPTSEYGPSVLGQLLRICDGEPHVLGDTMDKNVYGLSKGSVFPTVDLTIIMAGAWSAQRDDAVDAAKSAVGFAVGGRSVKNPAKMSLDDLHGIPRELRGRISRYAHLDDHDERSLAEIADRFGAEYMKSTNTWTRVDADARFGLVTHALGRGTGARGLRSAIVALRDWLLWHPDRVGPNATIGIAHVEAALAEADGVAA